MPKSLAARTDALRQSDIRAVTFAVNAAGGINLGQGICDLPTPDPIKAGAHAAIDGDRSIYTSYAGIEKLRAGIAEKARGYNDLPVGSDDEVVVSVGSTGAFVGACLTLFEPGDECIVFEPFYGYHTGLLDLFGVRRVTAKLRAPDWRIDWGEVESLITERTKAVLVCTPSNPCGKVWSRAELERMLEILERHDLWAITDEIYEYMTYDGHEHVSLGSLPGAYERTVTLSGFSKTYNMTGWRLGYAVGPEAVTSRMGLINDLVFICAPSPLQHGVAEAFAMDRAAYFAELQAAYAAKRQLMCETLEACGFAFHWPEGAYYVLADFSALAAQRGGFEDDRAACDTLIREAGVAAVPGNSFFADPADGSTVLRFCYAKRMPVLEDACRNLRAAFGHVPA
ncbi:MAG: pyridoxal phosphate-dependent aminotransferase [Bacteroidota bacterium]